MPKYRWCPGFLALVSLHRSFFIWADEPAVLSGVSASNCPWNKLGYLLFVLGLLEPHLFLPLWPFFVAARRALQAAI
jgi:hypothetical protein